MLLNATRVRQEAVHSHGATVLPLIVPSQSGVKTAFAMAPAGVRDVVVEATSEPLGFPKWLCAFVGAGRLPDSVPGAHLYVGSKVLSCPRLAAGCTRTTRPSHGAASMSVAVLAFTPKQGPFRTSNICLPQWCVTTAKEEPVAWTAPLRPSAAAALRKIRSCDEVIALSRSAAVRGAVRETARAAALVAAAAQDIAAGVHTGSLESGREGDVVLVFSQFTPLAWNEGDVNGAVFAPYFAHTVVPGTILKCAVQDVVDVLLITGSVAIPLADLAGDAANVLTTTTTRIVAKIGGDAGVVPRPAPFCLGDDAVSNDFQLTVGRIISEVRAAAAARISTCPVQDKELIEAATPMWVSPLTPPLEDGASTLVALDVWSAPGRVAVAAELRPCSEPHTLTMRVVEETEWETDPLKLAVEEACSDPQAVTPVIPFAWKHAVDKLVDAKVDVAKLVADVTVALLGPQTLAEAKRKRTSKHVAALSVDLYLSQMK